MRPKMILALCLATTASLAAQTTTAAPPPQNTSVQVEPMDKTPVYRVNVVQRSAMAVNYRHRSGQTKIDFRGTSLQPQAEGVAKVEGKPGRLEINADFKHMRPARDYGAEYLTYVLWAISPEGRPVNLGEVLLDHDHASMRVTTDLQAFGMIVTAEPYFSVTRPSDMVVLENVVRKDTAGWEQPINARYEALDKGAYTIDMPARSLPATYSDPGTPIELLEARNAVAISRAAGAEQYAPDALSRAQDFLSRAEDYYRRKQGRSAISTAARGAAQAAEDARVLAIRKKGDEQLAAERRRQEEQVATARANAEQARLQAENQAQRAQQAENERRAAEQARAEADAAAQRAQQERAALEQQRQQLQVQAQEAQQQAQRAEQEKEQMRARLLNQLNQVLQTRDTARGLIVNMNDVLFDTGKATLKPGARERLARVAGIVLAYPDLKLSIEGHTDSTGSDALNQRLSERRADAVRDYLISQGVPSANIAAQGLGKSDPIASNDTPTGRQLNRRVDLVVSGAAIATAAPGVNPTGAATATPATTGGISGTAGTNAGVGPANATPAGVSSSSRTITTTSTTTTGPEPGNTTTAPATSTAPAGTTAPPATTPTP